MKNIYLRPKMDKHVGKDLNQLHRTPHADIMPHACLINTNGLNGAVHETLHDIDERSPTLLTGVRVSRQATAFPRPPLWLATEGNGSETHK
jgi:hypothetical protein